MAELLDITNEQCDELYNLGYKISSIPAVLQIGDTGEEDRHVVNIWQEAAGVNVVTHLGELIKEQVEKIFHIVSDVQGSKPLEEKEASETPASEPPEAKERPPGVEVKTVST